MVPAPLGPFAVGTRRLAVVDGGRDDPLRVTRHGREVALQVWYPASRAGTWAGYAPPAVARAVAVHEGLPPRALAFRATATARAPVARGRFPLLVFSPGYGMTAYSYTALLEDLASAGFIVFGLSHVGEAVAAIGPGGEVRHAAFRADPRRLPATLLARLVAARVGDVRFVVRSARRLAGRAGLASALASRRIGAVGHSLGGLAASHAVGTVRRVACAANLSGSVFALPRHATFRRPYLLFTGSARDGTLGSFWRRLRGPRWWVTLRRARHLDFSDWAWLAPQLARRRLRPNAARQVRLGEGGIAIERRYLRAFFGRCLKGEDDHLLDEPPPFRDVTLRR